MDQQTRQAVYELLGTMGEALEHLRLTEREELRQLVSDARRQVTGVLEESLGQALEERISVSELSDEDWRRSAYLMMAELAEPFQVKNFVDWEFLELLDYLWCHRERELCENMRRSLTNLKGFSEDAYRKFIACFAKYPLWGTLDPDRGDYNTLELRAAVLKRHSYSGARTLSFASTMGAVEKRRAVYAGTDPLR